MTKSASHPTGIRQIFCGTKPLALVVLGLSEFVRGSLLFFILPIYVSGVLNLAPGVIGYALAAHYTVDTSLRSPAGWLTDRFGQRKVLLVALSIGFLGLWLVVQAQEGLRVILGSALLGIAMAAVWPGVISRVTSGLSEKSYATAMGGVIMAWLAGAGSGMVVMSWFLGNHVKRGFTSLFVLWLASLLIAMVAMQKFVPGPVHLRKKFQDHLRLLMSELYKVRLLFPGMFVQTFAMGLLLPVMALYAHYELGLDGRWYSYLLIAGGTGTVLLQLPMGRLVDKLGYKRFLVSGFALSSLILPVIVQFHSLWLVFLSVFMLGMAYALILPSWNSVLAQTVSETQRAVMWGVFMSVEGLGMALGPLAGSQLWQRLSPHSPFYAAAIILSGMTFFYAYAPLERIFLAERNRSETTLLEGEPQDKSGVWEGEHA